MIIVVSRRDAPVYTFRFGVRTKTRAHWTKPGEKTAQSLDLLPYGYMYGTEARSVAGACGYCSTNRLHLGTTCDVHCPLSSATGSYVVGRVSKVS